jgi:hypothetical protein
MRVRLLDDGHIRWPKHVVAKYNEYLIFIVLCFSEHIGQDKLSP